MKKERCFAGRDFRDLQNMGEALWKSMERQPRRLWSEHGGVVCKGD